MKNLKFRAWNNSLKRMIYSDDRRQKTYGWWGVVMFEPEKEHGEKIMQSTALEDKNGKEIYEGDILKERDGIGVVERFYAGEIIAMQRLSSDASINMLAFHDLCEVIGNIYENPELL